MDETIHQLAVQFGELVKTRLQEIKENYDQPLKSLTLKTWAGRLFDAILAYYKNLEEYIRATGELNICLTKDITNATDSHVEAGNRLLEQSASVFRDTMLALAIREGDSIRTGNALVELEIELVNLMCKISLATAIETVSGKSNPRLSELKSGAMKLLADKFITIIPGTGLVMSLVRLGEKVVLAPAKTAANAQDVLMYFEESCMVLGQLSEILSETTTIMRDRTSKYSGVTLE